MMARTFQEKYEEMNINPYELLEKKFEWKYAFKYVLDWRDRKAINLTDWLKSQIGEANGLDVLAEQLKKDTEHETAASILEWVYYNIVYTGDMAKWKTEEKWQTAMQTYMDRSGDCEDGAVLFFVLCRKAGIPYNHVRIVAGEVNDGKGNSGGHCWAEYIVPPFSYCMDWCYWTDLAGLDKKKPYIIGRSSYKQIWFLSNDEKTYGEFLR